MSDTARILHVDDDPDVLRGIREYLERHSIDDFGQIEVRSLEDFSAATSLLDDERFDLLILDVRRGDQAPEVETSREAGVAALEEVRQRRFLPVIFWTALPSQVEDQEAVPLVQVLEKREPSHLLSGIQTAFDSGLPAVNRALLRLVEDEQRAYMWDFVAPNWDDLRTVGDRGAVAYLLARRLGRSLSRPGIERLAERLGEPAGGSLREGTVHPAEMYIMPPVAGVSASVGELYRGSIAGSDCEWWMLITPSCDMHQNKAEFVILAECRAPTDHPAVAAWLDAPSNSNASKVGSLLSHKTGGQDDRYLFLPGAVQLPDLVVDLQRLASAPLASLDGMQRIGGLDSPFAEALVSRFTRYFGRVGTPDLDTDALKTRLSDSARQPSQ